MRFRKRNKMNSVEIEIILEFTDEWMGIDWKQA